MGGEKLLPSDTLFLELGSPPRGRGKEVKSLLHFNRVGITPALAGKRLTRPAMTGTPRDYPRVGGEKSLFSGISAASTGSPPHGRGKANWHCVRRPALRITPAHAGKRTRSWRAYGCPWDHPRVGGEKFVSTYPLKNIQGSPPHGRGKDGESTGIGGADGITPAQAGKRQLNYDGGRL